MVARLRHAKARSGIKSIHIRLRHAPDRIEAGDVMDTPRAGSDIIVSIIKQTFPNVS